MTGLRLRLGLKAGAQGQVCASVTEAVFPAVEGLLRGLPAGRAAQAVRRLHGLCRAAQGLCADLALAAATGTDMPASDLRAATGAALVEIARETGLRLCLDWAALLGEAPQVEAARALMQVTREGAAPDPDGLVGWIAARGVEGLPARVLAAAPAELAPAFAARLETLASIPARLAYLAAGVPLPKGRRLGPGHGEASVECARGRLVHQVRVEHGQVVEYRIDAPSARRFAPGGDALALLAACGDARAVDWTMQAIDPCVGWVLDPAVEAN